jgi:hypothetical protein
MRKSFFAIPLYAALLFAAVYIQSGCQTEEKHEMTEEEMIERGGYLVTAGGCHDCHSPKVMSDMGPMPDSTKLLAGHMADAALPPVDPSMVQPGKWVMTTGTDFTAWVGPWGISYAANLTPDGPTGLGNWTDEIFIKAMRTGKHMGTGRPILPPMPWFNFAELTDEDLKSIFAHLKSLPAVSNKVPDPVPPDMLASMSNKKK